eukprot:1110892_1
MSWFFSFIIILIKSNISSSMNLSFVIEPWLTYGDMRGAIGYDTSIDAILFYGGHRYPQRFGIFKNGNYLNGGQYFLHNGTSSYSQHYTQLNNELWMLRLGGGGFIKANTHTHQVTYPLIDIPTNVASGGCLTSIENHLIVIGSGTTSSLNPPTNAVQIYNINDSIWLDNVPQLKDDRIDLSCTVLNHKVYAIGGYGHDPSGWYHTIEVLDIANISQQIFTDWYYFSGSLSTARGETRAVSYGTDIFVIGGDDNSVPIGYPADVNRIDTVKGECDVVGYLSYVVEGPMPIVIGNILSVFGGYSSINDAYTYYDTYQYAVLPLNDGELGNATSDTKAQPGADASVYVAVISSILVFICFGLLFVVFRCGKLSAQQDILDRNGDKEIPQSHVAVGSSAPLDASSDKVAQGLVAKKSISVEECEGDDEKNDRQHHKGTSFVIRSESEKAPGANTAGGIGEFAPQNDLDSGDMEVKEWLDSIGYSDYHNVFVTNGFDSMDMVKEINDANDLNGIGISLRAHQIKISNHIKKLK